MKSGKMYPWPEETASYRVELEGLSDDFQMLEKQPGVDATAANNIRQEEPLTPARVLEQITFDLIRIMRDQLLRLIDEAEAEYAKTKPKSLQVKQSVFNKDASQYVLSHLLAWFTGQLIVPIEAKDEYQGRSATVFRMLARAGRKIGKDRLLTALAAAGVSDSSRIAEVIAGTGAGRLGTVTITEAVEGQITAAVEDLATGVVDGTQQRLLQQLDAFQQDATFDTRKLRAWIEDSYDFSPKRAQVIARTESARAYHTGQIEAWEETDIVQGKHFLVAFDACEFCQAAARKFGEASGNFIPVSQPFYKTGDIITGVSGGKMMVGMDVFGTIHPNCRCDIIAKLDY